MDSSSEESWIGARIASTAAFERVQPILGVGRHCRVEQGSDPSHARRDLPEQTQPFSAQRALSHDKTGGVAARPREACDEATADRIGNNRENKIDCFELINPNPPRILVSPRARSVVRCRDHNP